MPIGNQRVRSYFYQDALQILRAIIQNEGVPELMSARRLQVQDAWSYVHLLGKDIGVDIVDETPPGKV